MANMTNPIRIISHTDSTHCDTVQVFAHSVIVKRIPHMITVECNLPTVIGSVPCSEQGVCSHSKMAVEYLAGLAQQSVETWAESSDDATWAWGCTLTSNKPIEVLSRNGSRMWIITSAKEQTNVNQTE